MFYIYPAARGDDNEPELSNYHHEHQALRHGGQNRGIRNRFLGARRAHPAYADSGIRNRLWGRAGRTRATRTGPT